MLLITNKWKRELKGKKAIFRYDIEQNSNVVVYDFTELLEANDNQFIFDGAVLTASHYGVQNEFSDSHMSYYIEATLD